jgi:hypothetical protein
MDQSDQSPKTGHPRVHRMENASHHLLLHHMMDQITKSRNEGFPK